MKYFTKWTLINVAVIFIVALVWCHAAFDNLIFAMIKVAVVAFLPGVVLTVIPKTHNYGQTLLAAFGLIFLVGFSLCSLAMVFSR